MKLLKNLPVALTAVLLAACLIALLNTRDTGNPVGFRKTAATTQTPAVDDRLLRTARNMASMADTPAEQDAAREALRLADHAVDQAFVTALRDSQAPAAPANPALADLNARVAKLKSEIAADQQRSAQLAKQAPTNEAAAGQLNLVNAQIDLDKDELDDAEQDLAREGGDGNAAIVRALQQHQSEEKQAPPMPALTDPGAATTLARELKLWFTLGGRSDLLRQARLQAAQQASTVAARHIALDAQESAATPAAGTTTEDQVARLRRLSDQRKTLVELDKREQDCQQLAGVYKAWSAVVASHQRIVLHSMLGSLAIVFGILLVMVLLDRAIHHAFRQVDSKRLHQLRLIATLAVQLSAVVAILLILFGPPTQLSTIIGLATAGLTVVMKDFIVAFFGWFTLMGKNGIRVGDWVEIEGVSGEVIEIGVLKTVLLELGNWSNKGRPTGRQVAFSNSFAMEKHYFNFSTSNQWLWDQIEVAVPSGSNPYQVARQIGEAVERETHDDAERAAAEWNRVASRYSSSDFDPKPVVDLRPSGAGLDVLVRYITRAPQRDAVKSRLFHAIVDLLHKRADAPSEL